MPCGFSLDVRSFHSWRLERRDTRTALLDFRRSVKNAAGKFGAIDVGQGLA
jgi:hypothetical protein